VAKKNAKALSSAARLSQDLIAPRARLYAEFQDPYRAWEVWFLARSGRLDVPDWVCSYLDRVARQMIAISIDLEEAGRPREGRTVNDALELGRAKQSVAWKRAALRRRRQYAVEVLTLVEKGYTQSRAIGLVAEIHGLDPDKDLSKTIERAVRDIKKQGWRFAGGRGGTAWWPAPSPAADKFKPANLSRQIRRP
jgi:hypothetical protein